MIVVGSQAILGTFREDEPSVRLATPDAPR
jgi:hypothetical protein